MLLLRLFGRDENVLNVLRIADSVIEVSRVATSAAYVCVEGK